MRKTQAGFSLIEFVLASLCTMIMLGATFTLINVMFKANASVGHVMTTQQNVRVAMNTIARDITMAGTGLPTGTVVVPNGTNSTSIVRPGMASFPSPDRFIETPNNVIPIVSPGNNDGPTFANADTDALTIFSVDQTSPTWTVSTITVFSDRYELTFTQNVQSGAPQLFTGDLLLFNNANGSVLGCVTSVTSSGSNGTAIFANTDGMGINQPTAQFGNIASLKNPGSSPPVYPPTSGIRVNVVNYFISTTTVAHPRLMRSVNAQTAQVIAEDIESLQVAFDLYDFATNSSTTDQATTSLPNQIRAVHVSIAGRSPQLLNRTNDFYHFSLVSKVNVRNQTFRNRYTGT